MEAQALVARRVGDLARQEDLHRREQIQIRAERAMLRERRLDRRAALLTEEAPPHQCDAELRGALGQGVGAARVGRREDTDDLVAVRAHPVECLAAERGLAEERDAQAHPGSLARGPSARTGRAG